MTFSGADANSPPSPYSPWYLRYVMLIAFLVVTVSLMDRYVVSILLEQIKVDLSLTDTQLGLLVGPAFVVVHIIFQLPLARLADRSSRKRLIAGAMALWSFFTIAAGFAKTFPHLFVSRMGVGITEAACSPPLASMLSDFFSARKRGLAMSMLGVGGTTGIGAGMLIGGIVGQEYGWRTALIVAGIPGLILSVVMWFTIVEPVRGGSDNSAGTLRQRGIVETVKHLLGNRTYRWLIVGASLSMVTGIGRGAWEPVFLMRVYEMEQARAGIVYFLISPLPSVIGGILGGLMVDRLGHRDLRWYLWMPAIALFSSIPLMVAFLMWPVDQYLIPDLLPVGLTFSILGSIIGASLMPALIATGQSMVDASMRATSHAVWTMASNLIGMGLGPVAAGALSEYLAPAYGQESIRYALLIVSFVAVPAALALLNGSRFIKRDFTAAK